MFGNVGLRDRLTFSAFGASVNEVQRLQELTKSYRHNVIASEAFVGYTTGSWTSLGQEKLRGVEDAITVLSPDLSKHAALKEESAFEPSYDGLSDAENVMLLHRERSTRSEKRR